MKSNLVVRTIPTKVDISPNDADAFIILIERGLGSISVKDTATESEQRAVTLGRGILNVLTDWNNAILEVGKTYTEPKEENVRRDFYDNKKNVVGVEN